MRERTILAVLLLAAAYAVVRHQPQLPSWTGEPWARPITGTGWDLPPGITVDAVLRGDYGPVRVVTGR